MYSRVRPSAHEQQRLTLGPLAAVQVLNAGGRYFGVQSRNYCYLRKLPCELQKQEPKTRLYWLVTM